MNMKVSVIIPFYSRVDWLEEAIKSVLNQTYKAYEIIVINDGSKEDLDFFLNKYGNKIIYIKKRNEGAAIARNVGIEKSTGDYIAFLDSDDIWLPTKLEKQVKLMNDSNSIWSHTSYQTFNDGNLDIIKDYKDVSKFTGNVYPIILSSCPIATPTVMIRKDILEKYRDMRFNGSAKYGEDTYLWIQISLKYNILSIDEYTTKVRIRGSNAAQQVKIQLESRSTIWNYIKQDRDKYEYKKISIIIKIAYILCELSNTIINKIYILKNKVFLLEFISRILYIIPWGIFKIYSKFIGDMK